MDDNKGTTLISIHSKKGMQLFGAIKEKLEYVEVDIKEALKFNGAALRPAIESLHRLQFFDDIKHGEYEKVISKYSADSFLTKTKRFIKGFIQR